MESNHNKLPPNPCESANLFSKLSFWWTIDIFRKTLQISLGAADLFSANKNDSSTLLGDNLGRCWNKQTKIGDLSLLKSIGAAFKSELIQLSLLQLSVQIFKALGTPYFLGEFLLYFRLESDVSYTTAVRNAVGLLFSLGYVVVAGNKFEASAQHLGMRIRIAVCSLIYRKTLRLSRTALSDTNPGKVINLISNDVTRLEFVPSTMNGVWISPFISMFIIYLLWSEARWGSVGGIIILLLFAPAQSYFGKLTAKYRYKISIKTDERIRLMEEIISGYQVIKMYAWEKPFAKLIQIVRRLELLSIRKSTLLRANFLGLLITSHRIALFSTIVTLVLTNDTITASKVFSVLALYFALSKQIIRNFYNAFTDVSEMRVVIRRLQKYLEYEEIHPTDKSKHKLSSVVSIKNGMAPWNIINVTKSENLAFSLKNINIELKRGMLIGIIGPVGSGKTSLLQAILQELPLIDGSIIIDGNISYSSQEPWLFSGSIRQNILFGQEMDEARYDRTIMACGLLADFKRFPQGDNSYVGDNGAALSGGQKTRINLARAIYQDVDVYLFDDPLSAVDVHVGHLLFDSVIGPKSYLAEMKTTRVLVTHQVHYLSQADWIISLKNGTIEFQGTISDLSVSDLNIANISNTNDAECIRKTIDLSQESICNENIKKTEETEQNVEQSSKYKIDGSLLVSFIKCGATPFQIFLFVALFVSVSVFASLTDLWQTYLISREELRTLLITTNRTAEIKGGEVNLWSPTEYLYVYTALIFGFILILLVRSSVASNTMTNISRGLHDLMFNGVISSPLRFFDTNPSGRILNRFSKDLGNIDEMLPKALFDCAQSSLNIPLVYIVIAITYPILAIPPTIMLITFVYITRITLKSSNDIKRLEGITRSPVFSHMTSSIFGLSTIRAFKAENILIREFDSHQDIHSGAFFMYTYTNAAFVFALDLMAFMSISAIILIILFLDRAYLEGHKIGLVITQSIIIQDILYISAKQFVAICNVMMGVERIFEYASLPAEKQPKVPKEIFNNWPIHGKIEFKNVKYRYFNDGDAALTNLNFLIKAGEKIGIVGRTGAGKSSLIGAIFRLAIVEGKIFIDDVETGSVSLKDLRTKISVIPQDPILFSGTLRRNLDPFEEFDDVQLWQVLDEVKLKCIFLSSGLESPVLTGGSNFSVGQRQLLCLARALLRNNTILVLDEATANIDPETDVLIQRTIREKFSNCTVLTVAHRLVTIIDSDRVLVMQRGQIVEFDAPHVLLQKNDGIFRSMIKATGHVEHERLKNVIKNVKHS